MATVLSTSMKANPIVRFLFLLLLLRLKQLDMALQFTQGRAKESPLFSFFFSLAPDEIHSH
jgi:hypothetical protein